MQNLLSLAELGEALIENGYELKDQDGLDSREDHARLVGRMGRLLFQQLTAFLLHVSSSLQGPVGVAKK